MEIKDFFEPAIKFIKSWQKKEKEPASKQAAKDRLKLVLMQDRASVSPDFFEMMKKEIIDVIKKYIEIDEEALEVQLTRGIETGLEGPALYANIPIKNVKPIAPKGENEITDDENTIEIEEDTDIQNLEMTEEIVVDAMTEEQADAVAESILTSIENAVVSAEEKDSIIESAENDISSAEGSEDIELEAEKSTTKKATKSKTSKSTKTSKTSKSTATKAKTSSKKTTKKKTT